MKWVSVHKKLPDVGQEVLCFYTIGEYECYEVGRIESITITEYEAAQHVNVDWVDADHNVLTPTHWCALTPPTVQKERGQ